MSFSGFGISPSDFVAIGKFAWDLYKACTRPSTREELAMRLAYTGTGKSASPEFIEASSEVASLHTVLKELTDKAEEEGSILRRSGDGKQHEAHKLLRNCKTVLQELEKLLAKYQSLGRDRKRARDRIRFGFEDLRPIRDKLTLHASGISLFLTSLNSTSLGRIERKLDEIVSEIQNGQREPSILSVDSEDEDDGGSDAWWKALEAELLEEGLTRDHLTTYKTEILSNLQQLIKSSGLENSLPLRTRQFLTDSGPQRSATGPEDHSLQSLDEPLGPAERDGGFYGRQDPPSILRNDGGAAMRRESMPTRQPLVSDFENSAPLLSRPGQSSHDMSTYQSSQAHGEHCPISFRDYCSMFDDADLDSFNLHMASYPHARDLQRDGPFTTGRIYSQTEQNLKRPASMSFEEHREQVEYDERGRVRKRTVTTSSRSHSETNSVHSASLQSPGLSPVSPSWAASPGTPTMRTGSAFPGSPHAASTLFSSEHRSEVNHARGHEHYSRGPGADGLYHCSFEGCEHKADKLKCNYEIPECGSMKFSSTACLLRHERETHEIHSHSANLFICSVQGCPRSLKDQGFPRKWNLLDHMRRVHGYADNRSEISPPGPGPHGNRRENGVPAALVSRSTGTEADTGMYSCTSPGCPQRYETPTLLQRHKREAHHQTRPGSPSGRSGSVGGAVDSEGAGGPATATARQAKSFRCDRIDPATGRPCHANFRWRYGLMRHTDTIHNSRRPRFRCPLCAEDKTFSRPEAYYHLRVVHPDAESPRKLLNEG